MKITSQDVTGDIQPVAATGNDNMTQAHTPTHYIVNGRWDDHGNDYYTINMRDDKSTDEIGKTAAKAQIALNAHDELVKALQVAKWYMDNMPHGQIPNNKPFVDDFNLVEAALAAAQVKA